MSLSTLQSFQSIYSVFQSPQKEFVNSFVWLTDVRHPLFNCVINLSCPPGAVEEKVEAILQKISSSPITFWLHPENKADGLRDVLKQKKFTPLITCPLMRLEIEKAASPEINFDIRHVSIDTFLPIFSSNFQMNDLSLRSVLDKPGIEHFLLYVEGQPVTTGTLVVQDDKGGIFNVSTHSDHQKKGYATALMQYFIKRGQIIGLKELILLSSPIAEKLYQKLNFTTVFPIDILARL